MSYALKATEKFQREELNRLLERCTVKQVKMFAQCYPAGVPVEKLIQAIDLCARTVESNAKKEQVQS